MVTIQASQGVELATTIHIAIHAIMRFINLMDHVIHAQKSLKIVILVAVKKFAADVIMGIQLFLTTHLVREVTFVFIVADTFLDVSNAKADHNVPYAAFSSCLSMAYAIKWMARLWLGPSITKKS